MKAADLTLKDTMILGILSGVILVLLTLLGIIVCPQLLSYYRRHVPITTKQIARRKQTVQTWLVTKPICERVLCESLERRDESHVESIDKPPCDVRSRKDPEDMTEGSKDVQCCLICFEPFLVGECLSWSSTDDCVHAFHSSCIEEWLLRNTKCPCCRRMYLLVDYTKSKIPPKTLMLLLEQQKRRRRSTYFCIQDGLVTVKSLPDTESRRDKLHLDCAARSVSELDSGDDESLAESDEQMPAHDAGFLPPFRRMVLESLSAPASHNLVELRDHDRNGDDQYRVIRTKESTQTVSTTMSTNLSSLEPEQMEDCA
jgi:hypothetical protein